MSLFVESLIHINKTKLLNRFTDFDIKVKDNYAYINNFNNDIKIYIHPSGFIVDSRFIYDVDTCFYYIINTYPINASINH